MRHCNPEGFMRSSGWFPGVLRAEIENDAKQEGEDYVSIEAVQHIRRMRGGAQGHMMLCSDGNYYVVKFQNNPQHLRVLANEMLATCLANALWLPVPIAQIVHVNDQLVEHTPDLTIQLMHSTVPCKAGLQFGSRYAVDPSTGEVFDYLPAEMLGRVKNAHTFAGILAFDKWTGNADARQAAFWKARYGKAYRASFIDQGNCFNGGDWTFPDAPLRGIFARNEVYERVLGWEAFEPWLSRIENFPEDFIWHIGSLVPPEWYAHESHAFEALLQALILRRQRVRGLIKEFRNSVRRPFPLWLDAA